MKQSVDLNTTVDQSEFYTRDPYGDSLQNELDKSIAQRKLVGLPRFKKKKKQLWR